MEDNRSAEIWRRVTEGPRQEPVMAAEALLRESAALAAVYRRAAGKFTGQRQALARQLRDAEQATTAALRGMGRLSGHAPEQVRLWEPETRGALEGCYHRTRRCQAEYAARALDPQFGEVYRHLAEQAGKQCVLLTQLLGWE